MCYLKNFVSHENIHFEDIFHKEEESSSELTESENNVLIPTPSKHAIPIWQNQQEMLTNLFQIIERNNKLIKTMQNCLNGSSEYFEKNSVETDNKIENEKFTYRRESLSYEVELSKHEQSLCDKLFGAKKYKYSLQLIEKFPSVIYKERNFNLALKLVDEFEKPVKNCNIVSLCCSVSTSNAEWIHKNRVGEEFLKGKTEVELYNGEASFLKLYAREVSRVYPQGKVNLVIYAKPSTLLYSGQNSFHQSISSSEVQPLIVENLIIMAKKKE